MRVILILFFVVGSSLGAPAVAGSFRLCKDQPVQDRALYVQSSQGRALGCWVQVQNTPFVFEGSKTASNLPALPPRGTARFAYLIQQPEAPTVVVVKERVMRLRPDGGGNYLPQQEAYPSSDVILVRPPVLGNRCGDRLDSYEPAPGTRKGLVNIGEYNRYHEQTPLFGIIPNSVPRSDQLRSFHFRYPVVVPTNRPSCRDSDDGTTGNRQEYAFKGLSDSPEPSTLRIVANAITRSAYAANGFYSKLKVQNLYIGESSVTPENTQSNSKYYVASFTTDASEFTRTELTISNLQAYRDGIHWPTTWQMDWLNVRVQRK